VASYNRLSTIEAAREPLENSRPSPSSPEGNPSETDLEELDDSESRTPSDMLFDPARSQWVHKSS
jgi:hypothetical protein